MRAASVKIEWDEDGCYLVIDGDSIDPDYMAGEYRWRLEDPEQCYDAIKAGIGPWLREREDAEATFNRAYAAEEEAREAYALSDPKHPDFHSVHADIWDMREGK